MNVPRSGTKQRILAKAAAEDCGYRGVLDELNFTCFRGFRSLAMPRLVREARIESAGRIRTRTFVCLFFCLFLFGWWGFVAWKWNRNWNASSNSPLVRAKKLLLFTVGGRL